MSLRARTLFDDRPDEPVGRFTDWRPPAPRAAESTVYKLLVRGEPSALRDLGLNEERALRFLLKCMLRRFGLRCINIRREPPA